MIIKNSMKVAVLITLFAAICICSNAQSGQVMDSVQWAKEQVAAAPLVTRFERGKVAVPLVGGKLLPLVEVMINGKGPYRLLVDTGANVTLLQGNVVNELELRNLRPDGRGLFYIREIKIGDALFSGVVVVHDSWGEDIDGIVGFNVFKDCLLTFNYPQQLLQFEEGELPVSDDKEIVDYWLDKRLPHVNLVVNHDTIKVLVDTGMLGHLDVNKAEENRLDYVKGKESVVKSKSFYFDGDVIKRTLQHPITIAMYKITNSPIVISAEAGNRLGSSIFQHFSLTFDQKNQRIRFASEQREIALK